MTGNLRVRWTLAPAHPPLPWRHCSTCGAARAFASSGKVRLNANGRRLDAWLIYRCMSCDRTWLRPLFERVPVQDISPADLDAMQQSTRAWVRRHEFDVDGLKPHAEAITHSDDVIVTKPPRLAMADLPGVIALTLVVPSATGLRLDRFLSRELPVSRARLQSAHAARGLAVGGSPRNALRRKITADLTVTLHREAFSAEAFAGIRDAVFEG